MAQAGEGDCSHPDTHRGEKSNSSLHVIGMEVEKKTHPQLKPCVLVDGAAPERFVEAVQH